MQDEASLMLLAADVLLWDTRNSDSGARVQERRLCRADFRSMCSQVES